jgi:hypothetical protein
MELLLISSEDAETDRWNWDIDVNDGMPEVVPEGGEEGQEAAVVSYLETNTIPLMPERGVNWPGYLGKQLSLAEVDTQVRENLKTYLNTVLFSPVYSTNEGKLVVNLAKIVINTGA